MMIVNQHVYLNQTSGDFDRRSWTALRVSERHREQSSQNTAEEHITADVRALIKFTSEFLLLRAA